MAWAGAAVGLPAFGAIIAAAWTGSAGLFAAGVLVTGFGAGLFGHGTLTASMRGAPRERIGLALGAWGSVQASAAGLGVAAGGLIRDLIHASPFAQGSPEAPYLPVFALEILFLALALVVALPLLRRAAGRGRAPTYVAE